MKPDDGPERCPRQGQVRRLQRQGDGRWRKAAQRDLREMADDDAGARVLARALSAMLRRGG